MDRIYCVILAYWARITFLFIFLPGLILMPGCSGATPPIPNPVPGIVNGTILLQDASPVLQADVRLENTICLRTQNCESAITDANGRFSFGKAQSGIFDLVAGKKVSGIQQLARIRHLSVSGESLVARDLKLAPAGAIDGFVRLEDNTSASGIQVMLIGTNRSVTTTAGGYYYFSDVAYTYTDDSRNLTYTYQLTYAKDGYELRTVDNVEVFAGATTRVRVTEDSFGNTIPSTDVMVLKNLDPSGEAILEGTINLEARSGSEGVEVELLGTTIPPYRILSNAAGENTFNFGAVPVGTYSMEVRHADYFPKTVTVQISVGQTRVETSVTLTNVEHFGSHQMGYDLVVSPGGHQIAYVKYAPSTPAAHRELHIMDSGGQQFDTRLTTGAKATNEDRGMSWSYDGKYLIFIEENESSINQFYRMVAVPSAGGTLTPLTEYTFDVMQPAFEPMGYRLAWLQFATFGELKTADLVQRPSGLKLENMVVVLEERNAQIGRNQYSSLEYGQNGRLVFTRDDLSGTGAVLDHGTFTVPINASGNTLLKFKVIDSTLSNAASLSPSEDFLAWSQSIGGSSDRGVYLANIDGTGRERVAVAWGRGLDFSPDGKYVYFLDHRSDWERRIARMIVPTRWR